LSPIRKRIRIRKTTHAELVIALIWPGLFHRDVIDFAEAQRDDVLRATPPAPPQI
jgi:hypothetical protein